MASTKWRDDPGLLSDPHAAADPADRHTKLTLEVSAQPDDTTCGPTCLHAVYRYYGDFVSLDRLIADIRPLPSGGTLAVTLANHALCRGYSATIYTYNLQLFDPTWFEKKADLRALLTAQKAIKTDARLQLATDAYLEFLDRGGKVKLGDKTSRVIRKALKHGIPLLTGLSATYLYRCAREDGNHYDTVRGEPQGHFVVISGFDADKRHVMVADPLHDNPGFGSHYYAVDMDHLIASIMLGIVTYDANMLILQPPQTLAEHG